MLRPDRTSSALSQSDPPLEDIIHDLIERIDGLEKRLDLYFAHSRSPEPAVLGHPDPHASGGADPCRRQADEAGTPQAPSGKAVAHRPLPNPDTISVSGVNGRCRSPYLDAEEAAAYLGISVKSLYGIVERGRLEPLRGPRRRYRFTTVMLDEYLARREGR